MRTCASREDRVSERRPQTCHSRRRPQQLYKDDHRSERPRVGVCLKTRKKHTDKSSCLADDLSMFCFERLVDGGGPSRGERGRNNWKPRVWMSNKRWKAGRDDPVTGPRCDDESPMSDCPELFTPFRRSSRHCCGGHRKPPSCLHTTTSPQAANRMHRATSSTSSTASSSSHRSKRQYVLISPLPRASSSFPSHPSSIADSLASNS